MGTPGTSTVCTILPCPCVCVCVCVRATHLCGYRCCSSPTASIPPMSGMCRSISTTSNESMPPRADTASSAWGKDRKQV